MIAVNRITCLQGSRSLGWALEKQCLMLLKACALGTDLGLTLYHLLCFPLLTWHPELSQVPWTSSQKTQWDRKVVMPTVRSLPGAGSRSDSGITVR